MKMAKGYPKGVPYRQHLRNKEANKIVLDEYNPTDMQRTIHFDESRFRFVSAGRRSGKTTLAVNECIKQAYLTKAHAEGREKIIPRNERVIWWLAPVYGQAMIAWDIFKKYAKQILVKENKTERSLELKDGVKVYFKTCDKSEKLEGMGLWFVVIDEAAFVSESVWNESIIPSLADYKAKALCISRPCGRNWFYQNFKKGQNSEYKDISSYHFKSSDNPHIDPEEIERARLTLPKQVFDVHYNALFQDDISEVFKGLDKCIKGRFEAPIHGSEYVHGIDTAKSSDWTVMVTIHVHTRQVVNIYRTQRLDYVIQIGQMKKVWEQYKGPVLMDMTGQGGQAVYEMAYRMGLPAEGFVFTATTKREIIEELMLGVSRGDIGIPQEAQELLEEMEIYECKSTQYGVKYEHPAGKHDDCVDALALAYNLIGPSFGEYASSIKNETFSADDDLLCLDWANMK